MQGTKTILIRGIDADGDQIFELDERILGMPIIWNVSRIVRDAKLGKFGKTQTILMSELPPASPEDNANIDWFKVEYFARNVDGARVPGIMTIPVVNLRVPHPVTGLIHQLPIDGNHRLAARAKAGYLTFETWVVPEHLEKNYRVTIEEIADGKNTNTG